MALLVSVLALLLALPPLLSAQGAGQASSSRGGESKTPGTCRMDGGWTTKVMFPPNRTTFGVNDTVQVTCLEAPGAGQFPANCTELKGRGPVWDISGVTCLRMCNDWAKQVDFVPAQLEFGAGAKGLVTCRQQFQQQSFHVTCTEAASGRFEWDFGDHMCVRRCKIPKTWDPRLQFAPEGQFHALNESVTLSCREGYRPSPSVISCIRNGSQAVWSETPTCRGVCTTTAGDWPPSFTADSTQTEFAVGEGVEVTCRQEQYEVLTFRVQCAERAGQATWDTNNVSCVEKCQKPSGAPALRFDPDKSYYGREESVTLKCPEGFEPSQPELRCISQGSRNGWSGTAACLEKCKAPETWDSRVQFDSKQQFYSPGDSVTWRCPAGYQPSAPEIRCTRRGSRSGWSGTAACRGVCTTTAGDWPPSVAAGSTRTEFAVGEGLWVRCRPEQYEGRSVWMQCTDRAGRVAWDTSRVSCIEKCLRPQGDARLRFEPDRLFYGQNERTKLSCPAGSRPSLSEIVCVRPAQISASRNVWAAWDSRAPRPLLTEHVTCVGPPQISSGHLEVSPTTIQLRWTCSPAESCLGSWKIRARCQPDGSLSGPCLRPAGAREQTLQGLEGTLTCRSLQPFTSYIVTISGVYPASSPAPSSVLYSQRVSTSETAPDRPQIEPLDLTTQTLSWQELLPCQGAIVGYQLNITARREYDSSFLEGEALRVNRSVTKYRLRPWRHGTNYTVTLQGLTAAGPGQASRWDFETEISEPAIDPDVAALSVYNISPSNGTAVLPLQPIPGLHGPIREYQIIVSAMQNGSGADACHAPDLQPFNASLERAAYVAAVLPAHNLTGPTAFVLGDGARRNGYHNAPLHPNRNYAAFVRVVSRWKQVEKSSCVRYNFSIGAAQASPSVGLAIAVAVPLLLVLLLAGALLLWFMLSRKKRDEAKHHTRNGAIPLKRNRGAGASRLHTRIPVAELLETLKRFRRVEMEEEKAEDDANPERPPVGRNAEYQKLVSGLLHPCHAGKEPCNQAKNRYKSIIPYDHSRVVLQLAGPGADYINASYLDSYKSPRFFIAAQGPLPATVADFWQLIWQEKVSAIVMLTGLVEQNKTKCEQYWPEGERAYGDLTVSPSETHTTTGLGVRTFRLERAGCPLPRRVEQFHYLQWPDHGVPSNPARLLQLVEMVNERASEAPAGPVLVHCSAGIGRTGTFIALDFLLKMARAEGSVDVFHCVQRLREQRVSMVQTKEQYAFLYEALLEGLLCGNTGVPVENISSHVSRLHEPDAQTQSDGFTREFTALQQFSELSQLSPCREAEQPSNQPRNRKLEILPADCSRPILMSSLKADGSPGYINAVFVGTYMEEDSIIVTQLPLRETLVDFWALVWDYACTSLVMLNQIQELDQTYLEFWPAQGEASYGHFHVKLISEEPGAGFTIRTLAVTNRKQPNTAALAISFWQVDDWPMQQRLPPRPATVISLLGEVERNQRLSQDSHVLVTCWDGASRCGLFCAAGFLCEQIRSEGLLDVSQAVRMLKRQRQQLVKDVEQYRFCYELALSYLDSFKIYGNFQ